MTRYDDNDDLIAGLQHGLAARGAGISARGGIGDDARRAARRRTATRTVTAGVPVLAAAGVTAALTLGTSSGSASRPSVGATGAGSAASTPAGPAHVEDTAYVVKRVKAKVAEDSQAGTVLHTQVYASGDVSSNGSVTNLGELAYDGYQYYAADGSVDTTGTLYQTATGAVSLKSILNFRPSGHNDTQYGVLIDPSNQTYSVTTRHDTPNIFTDPADPWNDLSPNLRSTPAQVEQALQGGHVTDTGPTTVDGTPAIGLKITVPPIDGVAQTPVALFVDAQTYQPLSMVGTTDSDAGASVTDWMPTTSANIALAQGDSIPAGYTTVADVLR